AIAVTLLLAACTASEVDPDARIDLGGRVATEDGRAVAGVRVALSREADAGEVFSVFASLGLVCIEQRTDVCGGARVAKTGSEGRFAFRLTGRDTQGFAGQASTMVVSSGIGPRADEVVGPITTYRFQVQTESLNIPVRLWQPQLEGRTGSFGARVTWTPVPAGVLPGLNAGSVEHAIEFRRGREVVWTVDRARSGFAFDARLLEDTQGTAAALGTLEDQRVPDERGRRIDVVLRSGGRAYDSPAGAPPSRGRPCGLIEESGRLVFLDTCALTDGELEDDLQPSVCSGATGCVEPRHSAAVVDLGGRRPLSLIVVRGCRDRCTVDTSRDAKTWRTAGATSAEDAAIRVSPLVMARYVRVTSQTSIDLLREVSAWSGSGAVPAGPLFVEPGALQPASPPTPGATSSGGQAVAPIPERSSPWRLVALGAACAVLGGLVATLLNRRKRRGVASR
ncbi:MAG TPA: hypothetical protein VJ922_05385, partial [Actinomycetota bacterium]|nr:hypothetical protein [Actinomycetota bacterium]